MAPSRAQADAVRDGVASASACNSTISATLKQLLQDGLTDSSDAASRAAASGRASKTAARTTSRAKTNVPARTTASSRAAKATTTKGDSEGGLPPKEKAVLATQVINASLKALGEAAKSAESTLTATRTDATDPAQPSRKTLRRSASMPMGPLQPRALNKVATLPVADQKQAAPTAPSVSNGCLALVECAHVAFNCLRTLQSAGAVALPELQLESGLSSFINKLIGLSLFEHAFKEIRALKRRLDVLSTTSEGQAASKPAGATTVTTAKVFSELIDFSTADATGSLLSLIISTQLQTLRILHGMNKNAHLAVVLPGLRLINATCPSNLITKSIQTGAIDRNKGFKQLETLSQTILSLTCSLSSKDDAIAIEQTLSSRPETCLEAQALAFALKLQAWDLSKHKGDVDKEVLLPFSKCLQAFSRRVQLEPADTYRHAVSSFSQILTKVEASGCQPSKSSKAPMTAIAEMLAAVSQEAGKYKEAVTWMTKVRDGTDSATDSPARRCSVASQLLSLLLRSAGEANEALIGEVLEGLQGPLSGSTAELDDLLTNVCNLRKTAMRFLVGSQKRPIDGTIQQQLQAFVYSLPRFSLRWLGRPPTTPGSTKELLRFEQRRQLLKRFVQLIIDSALMLLKTLLDKEALEWDHMDPILQDILSLLEHFEDSFRASLNANPSNSYNVKVSHFYYQQHLILRKGTTKTTETTSLRALRRSIDSVKNVTQPERARAQLLVKWERFAELCRVSGRKEDAADTIRSIRDHLASEEVVQQLKTSLSTEPIASAWKKSIETEALSRAVCNLAKLDKQPTDWTWLLSGPEKFIALEHDLCYVHADDTRAQNGSEALTSTVTALLDLYRPEQYPVRRFRTLLGVVMRSLGHETASTQWHAEITATISTISKANLGEDVGLKRYILHLRSLAACVLALADNDLDTTAVREAMGYWGKAVPQCKTSEELLKHVDDPQQLLTVLQSLSDFGKIKGLQLLSTDALELAAKISQLTSSVSQDNQFMYTSPLILQQLQMGQSTRAGSFISQSEEMIAQLDIASDASSDFHLAAAEYYLAVGEHEKAEVHINAAQKSTAGLSKQSSKKVSGFEKRLFTARASSIASLIALERGESHHALDFAKLAVQTVFHDWARFESKQVSSAEEQSMDITQHDTTEGDSALSQNDSTVTKTIAGASGPRFWKLACALFEFTLRLSWFYAHFGLFQETVYYAEQARKIANTTQSAVYTMQATAWLAFVHSSAGDISKAVELASTLLPTMNTVEPTYLNVRALCQLSKVYQQTDPAAAANVVSKAEHMIKTLAQTSKLVQPRPEDCLEDEMAKLTIAETTASKLSTRQVKSVRTTKTSRTKTATTKTTTVSRTKTKVETTTSTIMADVLLRQLQAAIFQQQSLISIKQREWASAIATLDSAAPLSSLSLDVSEMRFLQAVSLVGQSLEQMGHDSVFSVIQESTLSFPAISAGGKEKLAVDRASLPRSPGPRHAPRDIQGFQDGLRQAQEYLLEAHSIAVRNGDGALVHRVAVLLQNVFVLLSTTVSTKVSRGGHPAHATCSVEMARNLVWRRERKTLPQDSSRANGCFDWPMLVDSSDSSRRSSLGPATDMAKFQRDFIDIIPRSWNVVSISLGAGQHDLCITKLQAGHSPFAIRLPLERANSRDADIDVFDFRQGRSELLDIIKDINRTCHDARDMSQKGAKAEWWAEREALDERMKELLDNVEQTWLGGFKGVFAPGQRRPDLLARFQRSFLDILDKHLPSRRQVRGKKPKGASAGPKITLDPRIYELFVNLGDATAPEADLDEPLNDLLYFVVDILQFNGERNAYDEIDFDAMVVDAFDAIHSYQTEASSSGVSDEGAHTILIVDKALHIFPWESLPCMEGSAVSRIPSLACLRRLILEQNTPHRAQPQPEQDQGESMDIDSSTTTLPSSSDNNSKAPREGHHVSIKSGSYILNPGADLKNTQSTFGRPLASLPPTWTSIEGRTPTEAEFEASLTGNDLLLYFGHGSGAQYIRGRTVRRLPKCRAAALLMGCSSASLADVGDFECHGPVWNYMLAGSPAVAGTLWDVTDRDIDRFAGRVFEEWGLLPHGTFSPDESSSSTSRPGRAKGKRGAAAAAAAAASGDRSESAGAGGRGRSRSKASKNTTSDSSSNDKKNSLVEAIVQARDACRFKYLTAAAVVVYGIPVYIGG